MTRGTDMAKIPKTRTVAYHNDPTPQTSPSLSGPVITYRIADLPPEKQAWLDTLKPPTNSDGQLHKKPVHSILDKGRKVR